MVEKHVEKSPENVETPDQQVAHTPVPFTQQTVSKFRIPKKKQKDEIESEQTEQTTAFGFVI